MALNLAATPFILNASFDPIVNSELHLLMLITTHVLIEIAITVFYISTAIWRLSGLY